MTSTPIPVAQYLRMSSERQEYSLDNQSAAIREYADARGFAIVRTYSDAGKSGLVLARRLGLQQLLADVVNGRQEYRAILVYDVSRWGRFQDNDEAAHYEFLCKSSGIPIHYCAEQFVNDGALPNLILKSLKRTLAAEYSRELGVKVYAGKSRLAQLGFRQGGQPGLGLRRLMISDAREPKQLLNAGEYKSLTTDRVVLVPGPDEEVELVRTIFRMALRCGTTSIVRYLNEQGFKTESGRPWTYSRVLNLLTNPKYIGMNVWGRTSFKLQSRRVRNSTDKWNASHGAFTPLVDEHTFDCVQEALHDRAQRYTDDELLKDLKKLWKKKGKLTQRLISQYTGHSNSTYFKRFGNLRQIYELIGYRPSRTAFVKSDQRMLTVRSRERLLVDLEARFPGRVNVFRLAGKMRNALRVDNQFTVSAVVCRHYTLPSGTRRWELVPPLKEWHLITLLCLQNADNSGFHSMYLFPGLEFQKEYQIKGESDPWLCRGVRLRSLAEFYEAARIVSASRQCSTTLAKGLGVKTG